MPRWLHHLTRYDWFCCALVIAIYTAALIIAHTPLRSWRL